MKMWKKLIVSMMSAVMIFTLLSVNVCATETPVQEPYTYTVTFYAGNHGTFGANAAPIIKLNPNSVNRANVQFVKSPDKIVVSGLEKGDKVGINAQPSIALETGSKYYAKGIRLSGRDNNTVADSIFEVEGDADYVAAYGIKGDQVKYTVRYLHEDGEKLAEDDVFYGNVGDKPIVAYKYIEGYMPTVFGLTKTLSANEDENIFEFIYVDAPEGMMREIYTYLDGGVTVVGGGATNVTGGGAGAVEAGEGTAGGGEEAIEAGEGAGEAPIIVDLDDEETPLANVKVENDGTALPMAVYVGMGLLALLAIIAAVYIYQKYKKKEEA